MNSNIVIIALLQFTLVCTPLVCQVAAMDQEESPDQQWICRELCPASIKQNDSLQVKKHRMTPPQDLIQNSAQLKQGDLLQELIAPEAFRHISIQQSGNAGISQLNNNNDNNRQEDWFLKELTAETLIP